MNISVTGCGAQPQMFSFQFRLGLGPNTSGTGGGSQPQCFYFLFCLGLGINREPDNSSVGYAVTVANQKDMIR
jgi:hypothetical protein